MANQDPDEVEDFASNRQLDEVLDFYDCEYLLPFASRVLWLSAVKEALGRIPDEFNLTYDEIQALVTLSEEIHKKSQYDSNRLSQESSRVGRTSPQIRS